MKIAQEDAVNDSFYRYMFLGGAVWNLLGGLLIGVFYKWIFETYDLTPPDPPNYYLSWIALFMAFGIGYYMIYRDLYNNINLVILGIIGKLAFAGIFLYYMIQDWDLIPSMFLLGVIGDLIFVALYSMFLNHARNRPASP